LNQFFEKEKMTGVPAFIQSCICMDLGGFVFLSDLKTTFFAFLISSGEDVTIFKNISDRRLGELICRSFDQVFGKNFEVVCYSKRDSKIRGYGI
jgi:hypothetical protein